MLNYFATCYEAHFFNVGQGLFASGQILGQNFCWVFDCGSSSKNGKVLLQRAIARFPHKKINLLAISHFDQDHINGLDDLLQNRQVQYWLLPYYPLWQRLIIAGLASISADDELFQYYLDPIAYLNEQYGDKIDTLLISTDHLEEISLEQIKQNENIEQCKFAIQRFADVQPLVPFFEFKPYNVPLSMLKNTKIGRNWGAFKQKIEHFIQQKNISGIKQEYDQFFNLYGKSKGKYRNLISTFLYISPIVDLFFKHYLKSNHIHLGNMILTKHKDKVLIENPTKTALLYCGDGFLKNKHQINDLKNHLTAERWQNILCLQVPHHGSYKNWQTGLAKDLAPSFSVFCADPRLSYHHPHAQVVFDLLAYRPILVDHKNDFILRFI